MVQIQGNCCASHAAAIGVFVFTVFLNEVNAPADGHVGQNMYWGDEFLNPDIVAWWTVNKTIN
jgi:hypothetical protein